jgi:hypothetical protein
MTLEQSFPTETDKEKRIHRIRQVNDILVPSVKYINKDFRVPNKLFKYYECNENNINALMEGYLWASDPNAFNDRLDCSASMWEKASFSFDMMNECFPPEFVSDIKGENSSESRNQFIEFYIRKMGVICLNSGKNKDLLWAYYNYNRGFCIEFNSELLIKDFAVKPIKLEYCKKIKKEKLSLDKYFYPKMVRWATIKKKNWKIEDEWRFIFLNSYSNRKKMYSKDSIKKIILGYDFFEDFDLVKNNKPVYIFRTKYTTNKFKIKLLNYLKEFPPKVNCWLLIDENTVELVNVPISIKLKSCRSYEIELFRR